MLIFCSYFAIKMVLVTSFIRIFRRLRVSSRSAAVSKKAFKKFCRADGRIKNVHALKSLIFQGGIEMKLRPLLWKYLLGYYDWNATFEQNSDKRKQLSDYYYQMKIQWMSLNTDQESRFAGFRDRKALIEKDVHRTDRSHTYFQDDHNLKLMKDILMTYAMFDFDLGYAQGMSDLLGPIMIVMDDEVDAFWTFVGLMKRVHSNFEMDQLSNKKQLLDLNSLIKLVNPRFVDYLKDHDSDNMYFAFRWILINFKREFKFEDIMYLWEVLWTDIPCKNFLLLVCVAILNEESTSIIKNGFGMAEIVMHINNLSMNMDLHKILMSAEAIYEQLVTEHNTLPEHVREIIGFNCDNKEKKLSVNGNA